MRFDIFLTFNGDCRKALDFYTDVFNLNAPEHIMVYGQAPNFTGGEHEKNLILYAQLPIYGLNVMFSDTNKPTSYLKGNNIMLTLGVDCEDELNNLFAKLSTGGNILMPLGKTFFAKKFAMVMDKFGIIWQLSFVVF